MPFRPESSRFAILSWTNTNLILQSEERIAHDSPIGNKSGKLSDHFCPETPLGRRLKEKPALYRQQPRLDAQTGD